MCVDAERLNEKGVHKSVSIIARHALASRRIVASNWFTRQVYPFQKSRSSVFRVTFGNSNYRKQRTVFSKGLRFHCLT